MSAKINISCALVYRDKAERDHKVPVSFRLEESKEKRLKELAVRLNTTVSDVLAQLVDQILEGQIV